MPKLRADPENVTEWFEPVDGQPLNFETTDVGQPHDVKFRAFCQLSHQRYTISWDLLTEAEWTQNLSAQESRSYG